MFGSCWVFVRTIPRGERREKTRHREGYKNGKKRLTGRIKKEINKGNI